jgi:hypothetical protein
MALHALTSEVHAHLSGHPVEVSSPPVAEHEGDAKTIILNAGESEHGACGCTLEIHGTREQLRKVFENALALC